MDIQLNGLGLLTTNTNKITICSAKPTTYAQATTTYRLGQYTFGVGLAFGSPSAATPNGRKVSSNAITGGSVTTSGTATHWAAVDDANTTLLATNALSASVAVTSGAVFNLPSFTVTMPAQ